jgi:hypothetical protein
MASEIGKTISDAAKIIPSALQAFKDPAPVARPTQKGTQRSTQGGTQGGGSVFSTLMSFLPGPMGGIASFVGGLLGSK